MTYAEPGMRQRLGDGHAGPGVSDEQLGDPVARVLRQRPAAAAAAGRGEVDSGRLSDVEVGLVCCTTTERRMTRQTDTHTHTPPTSATDNYS